jgi:hypothetical protein
MYYNTSASTVNYGTSFIQATGDFTLSPGYMGQVVNILNTSVILITVTASGCNFRDINLNPTTSTFTLAGANGGSYISLVFNGVTPTGSWLILSKSV